MPYNNPAPKIQFLFKIASEYFKVCTLFLILLVLSGCGGESSDKSSSSNNEISLFVLDGTNDQRATVGTALPNLIRILARDGNGNPTPNITVKFNITKGNGRLTSNSVVTGKDGIAITEWTLGQVSAPYIESNDAMRSIVLEPNNELTVTLENLSNEIKLFATGIAGAPASIEKIKGDNQIGGIGLFTTEEPAVIVKDQYGNSINGVDVLFSVANDDSFIRCSDFFDSQSCTVATTLMPLIGGTGSLDLKAQILSWQLGQEFKTYTISASVVGFANITPVTFTANIPDVYVSIESPLQDTIVGDAVNITANITSKYQLTSVIASADTSNAPLTFNNSRWNGNLAMPSIPPGDSIITVKATDVFGTIYEATLPVRLDRDPVISEFSMPSFAGPEFSFLIKCIDDNQAHDPFIILAVEGVYENPILAADSNIIAQEISLEKYNGKILNLTTTCVGSGQIGANPTSVLSKSIYVDSSSKLNFHSEIDGLILDFSDRRILFEKTSPTSKTLFVKNLLTDITTEITSSNNIDTYFDGHLYSSGVVYSSNVEDTIINVWNGSDTTSTDITGNYIVSGDFVLFSQQTENNEYQLVLRNLLLQSNEVITTTSYDLSDRSMVNSDGAVVYLSYEFNVYRYENNSITQLTNNGSSSVNAEYRYYNPKIVGDKTYYIKSALIQNGSERTNSIILNDGMSETIVHPDIGNSVFIESNGFFGLLKVFEDGTTQIFRIDQDGNMEQLSFFGSPTGSLDAITPDGTIFFHNQLLNKSYRAKYNQPAEEIGSAIGSLIYSDGHPFVIMGGTILEIL